MKYVLALFTLALASSCKEQDASMQSSSSEIPILSSFAPFPGGGGGGEVAPEGTQIVMLSDLDAVWWEAGKPIRAELPGINVHGARWERGDESIRVGPGVLDLTTRKWRHDLMLARWNELERDGGRPIRAVAWTRDSAHAALLIERRNREGDKEREVVIVDVGDGRVRGRHRLKGPTHGLIASEDRVMVAMVAAPVLVLDLDAKVIEPPAPLPDTAIGVREGGGMFSIVGVTREVTLVRPSDGAVLATWEANAIDAVPFTRGVVTIDVDGLVRVACLVESRLVQVAEADTDLKVPTLGLAASKLVVEGKHPTHPALLATFTPRCR